MDGAVDWRRADLDALALEHLPALTGGVFGVVVQDGGGAIVAASPVGEGVLGLTFEQMIGRTSTDPRWMMVDVLLHPLAGDQHPAMRVLVSGRPVHDVVVGVHRPHTDVVGTHVWVSVTAIPIRPQPDGPLHVLSVLSPLTGAPATELRLVEAQANFRFIADNSSDMVAWQRFDTTYLWVSPASNALLGRTPEEMVGLRAVDLAHPDDRPNMAGLERAVTSGVVTPRLCGGCATPTVTTCGWRPPSASPAPKSRARPRFRPPAATSMTGWRRRRRRPTPRPVVTARCGCSGPRWNTPRSGWPSATSTGGRRDQRCPVHHARVQRRDVERIGVDRLHPSRRPRRGRRSA